MLGERQALALRSCPVLGGAVAALAEGPALACCTVIAQSEDTEEHIGISRSRVATWWCTWRGGAGGVRARRRYILGVCALV